MAQAKKIIYIGSTKVILNGDSSSDENSGKEVQLTRNGFEILDLNEAEFKLWLEENWDDLSKHPQVVSLRNRSQKELMKGLKKELSYEKAAGGFLRNEEGYLLIKRNGMWDLPKGKLDPGEKWKKAARREVEEETGIKGKIENKLLDTWHIFKRNEKICLKKTRWYSMVQKGKEIPIPQESEGITELGFFPKSEAKALLESSYENIKLVWNEYFQSE